MFHQLNQVSCNKIEIIAQSEHVFCPRFKLSHGSGYDPWLTEEQRETVMATFQFERELRALNSVSPCYLAKGKTILSTNNCSLFYGALKSNPHIEEGGSKAQVNRAEWGVASSMRMPLISDQSSEIKRNSAVQRLEIINFFN